MLTEINIKIDDSILLSLKEKKETVAKDMLFHYALTLYRSNKLSLGKAAELAGYDRFDFIQLLKLKNEPVFDYEREITNEMAANAEGLAQAIKDARQ